MKIHKSRLDKILVAKVFGRKSYLSPIPLTDVQSILINPIGDAVGDAVICTAYANQLRQMYPHAQIGIFCTNRNREIFMHCPSIDKLLDVSLQSYYKNRKKWDLLIDFYESFTSSTLIKNKILAPKRIMIFKKRDKTYYNSSTINNYDDYCHFSTNEHVSRHLNSSTFADYFTVPEPQIQFEFSETEKQLATPIWQKFGNNCIRVFIAPQGSVPFKAVSPKEIATVLNKVKPEWRSKTTFVLCNTKNAPAFFADLKSLCAPDIQLFLAPKTTLKEYIALTASANIVISVDSGTAHLACAAKVPLLSYYVCHNIKMWSPMSNENVPHFMMVASTRTSRLDHEDYSWDERNSFPLSVGAHWLNRQLAQLAQK